MDPFAQTFLALVTAHGEKILFFLAALETCFVTGAIVESGMATSFSTWLAREGHMSLGLVALAAAAGGALGDSVGFWIGRLGGEKLQGTRAFRRFSTNATEDGGRLFGRHPIFSVSMARLVPFVRSAMPLVAGMSPLAYPRFLMYESIGVAAWCAMYMAIGWLAGESWQLATSLVGGGWALLFVIVGTVLWVKHQRRRRRLLAIRRGAPPPQAAS